MGGGAVKWIGGVVCLVLCAGGAQAETPSFAEVRAGYRSSYAELHDREGKLLHARRVDFTSNRLYWVALADISPALTEAVVFAEDREFWQHKGVDWSATAVAAMKMVTGDRSRGASTITMQLAGLLDKELAWRRGGRSLAQKWSQMQAARDIEHAWSKPEIIEAYLNLVSFRGDVQGIAATSLALFGKQPKGLIRNESLLLAALLPSPQAEPGRVATRACALINAGFMNADCQAVRDLALTTLNRRLSPYPESPALDAMASTLLKEPAGVAGLIIPWNAPVVLLIRALTPALAAGCTVVIKPAPQSALITAAVIYELHAVLAESGDRVRGVVNLVSENGHEAAQALVTSSDQSPSPSR